MARSAALLRLLLPPVMAAATACGGGGGGGTSRAPSPVELSFPSGAVTTDAVSMTIRGTVALPPPIDEVRVNGVAATSSDGFATFAATVIFPLGVPDDVVVEVERPNLPAERFTFPDRVTRIEPIVVDATDVALDATNHRLLLVDAAGHSVVAVDLATQERTIVTDLDVVGPALVSPISIDVDTSGATGFVLDEDDAAIVKVDLATGVRTAMSGGGSGVGIDFAAPQRLAFEPASGRVLVTDPQLQALFTVSTTIGARKILSDSNHGSGPLFKAPFDVVVDSAGNRALVSDPGLRAIVAVDLTTGNRTILSDSTHGSGDFLQDPTELALDPVFNTLLVTDVQLGSVFFVDLTTGDRNFLFQDEGGAGTEIGQPGAMAAEPGGEAVDLLDGFDRTLVHFDLRHHTRTTFVELPAIGHGPALDRVGRVAVDAAARVAWIASVTPPAVLRVDLETGERATFSDATHGRGRAFVKPVAIALDAARDRLLVNDDSDDSLWSVSLRDASRTLVSTEPVVAGDDLHQCREIVLDDARGRALLVQSEDLILAVDLASGARSEFSFDDPVVFDATRMDGGVLDAANGRLLVHDQALGLFAVSLADGARSFVSPQVGNSGQDGGSGIAPDAAPTNVILLTPRAPLPSGVGAVDPVTGLLQMVSSSDVSGAGSGPTLHKAITLSLDAARQVALVVDQDTAALFEVDLVTGARAILSR